MIFQNCREQVRSFFESKGNFENKVNFNITERVSHQTFSRLLLVIFLKPTEYFLIYLNPGSNNNNNDK